MPPYPLDRRWPIDQAVELACLLEASAAKVGNVHPSANFGDTHFGHFAASAVAIATGFRPEESASVGQIVLDAVASMRSRVGRNTHLGTILLLAPLAKAACCDRTALRNSVESTLSSLTPQDSELVYQAIRLASPGGLGTQADDDVTEEAPCDLIAAMKRVAEVDAVARQYTNGFNDVLSILHPWLIQELGRSESPLEAIERLQIRWLAHEPDGLIIRKVGIAIAEQAQHLAIDTLDTSFGTRAYAHALEKLDTFLRADGNRRNPGTTADLIAAALFIQLVSDSAFSDGCSEDC